MGPLEVAVKPTTQSDQATRITIKKYLTEKIGWLCHVDGLVCQFRVLMLSRAWATLTSLGVQKKKDQLNLIKLLRLVYHFKGKRQETIGITKDRSVGKKRQAYENHKHENFLVGPVIADSQRCYQDVLRTLTSMYRSRDCSSHEQTLQ
jgi:hypothetical protein